MSSMEVLLLQKKIADYPERIDKMQKRYGMIMAPRSSEISSAIKGLNSYMLQLKVNRGSFAKLKQEIDQDVARLQALEGNLDRTKELSESIRLSVVQVMHAKATTETYLASIDAQIDGAVTAKEKLELAQKQKKTVDVINLLTMIQNGDGYKL